MRYISAHVQHATVVCELGSSAGLQSAQSLAERQPVGPTIGVGVGMADSAWKSQHGV